MTDFESTASLMTPSRLASLSAKPAASPAFWQDPTTGDIGRTQLQHLVELHTALGAPELECDLVPLRTALTELLAAHSGLDFDLLQSHGWLARALGKARSAGAEFSAQAERLTDLGKGAHAALLDAQKLHGDRTTRTERLLLDMDVEHRALEQLVEHGARWLQDMRQQLQQRHAAAANDPQEQQRIRAEASRCEALVVRLKALRSLAGAVGPFVHQYRAVLTGRNRMLQTLSQALPGALRAWQPRISALATAAEDGEGAALSLEGPREVHQALGTQAGHALAEVEDLQNRSDAMRQQHLEIAQQLKASLAA